MENSDRIYRIKTDLNLTTNKYPSWLQSWHNIQIKKVLKASEIKAEMRNTALHLFSNDPSEDAYLIQSPYTQPNGAIISVSALFSPEWLNE